MRVVDYQRERLRAINASELISRDVLLLDGGLATEVEKYNGVNLSEGILWSARLLLPQNAHLQQAIVNAHVQYYSSGADIVTTASYQASLDGLLREFQGDSNRAEEAIIPMLMKSVELAGIARDSSWKGKDRTSSPKPLIAASIGCYGAALADGSEYRGEYKLDVDELMAWHSSRFLTLSSHSQVDILIFETIPCLREVEAIVCLLNAHTKMIEERNLKIVLAVACRSEFQLNSGEPISKLTEMIQSIRCLENLLGVGINCTNPKFVESLLLSFSCSCDKVVYPNSGEEWNADQKRWERPNQSIKDSETDCPTDWNTYLPKWYNAGARIFGGCCRTTPDDIKHIRQYFQNVA